MQKPSRRGTKISPTRIAEWQRNYHGYRHEITADLIQTWLSQFSEDHLDIAARVLDSIEFISGAAIEAAYVGLLDGLPGWSKNAADRTGKWRFVPFSRSEGESGSAMMHRFRMANNLAGRQYDELFVHWSQLTALGSDDTVVFIDDFSGSGNQVVEYWQEPFDELLAQRPTTYLLLIAATTRAQKQISEHTLLELRSSRVLDASDDLFSPECKHFTAPEKNSILSYCEQASLTEPKGRGECGLLIVLSHKAPNNSIAILHKQNRRWTALFRRYN